MTWRALPVAVVLLALAPSVASAHGPVAPVATNYLARLTSVPAGIQAKIVDGYVRIWVRAAPDVTLTVPDYRGAPYLRFSRSGVEVNQNSEMYYLNQTPYPETPPANLGPHTAPDWQRVSSGHAYEWHDGRLQGLASVALAPGTEFVGRWRVPVALDGRAAAIGGGLWHRGPPSIVWFWPIVVLALCVLAGLRLRRPALDLLLARGLALAALVALVLVSIAHELHGRPGVPVLHLVELAVLLAFAAWAARAVLFQRPGWLTYFAIAVVTLFEGAELIPTLLNGYVLLDRLPTFVVRAATVACLAAGLSILPLVYRLAEPGESRARRRAARVGASSSA